MRDNLYLFKLVANVMIALPLLFLAWDYWQFYYWQQTNVAADYAEVRWRQLLISEILILLGMVAKILLRRGNSLRRRR